MKARVHLGRWRSPRAERRFRAMEDVHWRERGGAPDVIDVETEVATTRVYRWPGAGDPIVFLHGMGASSLMWVGYVDELRGRDLYAIDTPGDVGRSVQRVAYEGPEHLARWLDETLAALGIARAHLAGASYGGFLAVNQAVRRPARVASIALLDPVGIATFRMARFLLWGTPILLAAVAPGPLRRVIARRLRMPVVGDRRMVRMLIHGQVNHPFRLPPPQPFTDDELGRITVPVSLLVGAKSPVHRAASVIERARGLIADVDAETVADAGHGLALSHVELVAARLEGRSREAGPLVAE